MLLPGLEARVAGPASILAWGALILLSAGFACAFAALGVRIPHGGITAYAQAGFGETAGRFVTWCFVAGVVIGTPYVCLIGGSYFAALLGWGRLGAAAAGGALLIVVVLLAVSGARAGVVAQVILVAVLVAVVLIAATGSLPHASAAQWSPFAPHGWLAVGAAASSLIVGVEGWEAISPLIGRLRDPGRQLPRVIAIAFAITSGVYLLVVTATIGVLGAHAGAAPLAELLRIAVGQAGPALAMIVAVALTLGGSNAYVSGAVAAIAGHGPEAAARSRVARRRLLLWLVVAGVLGLAAFSLGVLDLQFLVELPAALSLTVYLACIAAAARIFRGAVRALAWACIPAVVFLLVFTGVALVVPAAIVALLAVSVRRRRRGRDGRMSAVPPMVQERDDRATPGPQGLPGSSLGFPSGPVR